MNTRDVRNQPDKGEDSCAREGHARSSRVSASNGGARAHPPGSRCMPRAAVEGTGTRHQSAKPQDPDYTAAVAAIKANEFARAIPLLDKVIAATARTPTRITGSAYATRKNGDAAGSIPIYEKALAIDPKHRGAHEYIGEAYLVLGDLAKAKQHLASARQAVLFPLRGVSGSEEGRRGVRKAGEEVVAAPESSRVRDIPLFPGVVLCSWHEPRQQYRSGGQKSVARTRQRPGAQSTPFEYGTWSRLLAAVVTADGKVDYEALAARRDLLDTFVAMLATASPDTDPERFPSEDHALAYWINAYNAFVLHAVIEEYPIRSVWKVRDGQFFARRRHDAGGRVVSLDDIEHRILRGRFAEPRIHFAINCASNGCPPMRTQAYQPDGIRDDARSATRQFLASEWNCRVDSGAQADLRLTPLPDVRGGLRRRRRLDRGVPAGRARLRRRAHRAVARRARRVRGGVQRLRLGAERHPPRPEPAARSRSTRAWRRSTRAISSCASCTSTTETSATGLLLVHGVRLAQGVARGLFRARARLGGGGRRPRRQHQVLRRRADPARRRAHRGHAPLAGPRLPGLYHDLLERRAGAGADPHAGAATSGARPC